MSDDQPPWHVVCVEGDVLRPLAVTAADLSRFPQREVATSRGGISVRWQGVDAGWLLALTSPRSGVRFAVLHSGERGLCLPVEQLSEQNALLALRADGRWLTPEQGGPCRLVLPGSRRRESEGPIDRVEVLIGRPAQAEKSRSREDLRAESAASAA